MGQAPDVHPQNIHAVGDAFAVDSFSEKLEIVSPIQATKALNIPHDLLDTGQVVTGKCYGTAVDVHPQVGDEVCKPPVVEDSIAEIQNDKTPDKDIIKNIDGDVPTEIQIEIRVDRDDNYNKDDVGLGTFEHLNADVSIGIQIDDISSVKFLALQPVTGTPLFSPGLIILTMSISMTNSLRSART